jgi:hypothetical protein
MVDGRLALVSPLRVRRPADLAEWVKLAVGAEFWIAIVLAVLVSPWYWLPAAVAFAANLILHLVGTRDVLEYISRPVPKQSQTSGDGSTNMQAGRDITPAPPTAERGQFWMGQGPAFAAGKQLAVDREAKERADYELTKQKLGMVNHPAGKGKP